MECDHKKKFGALIREIRNCETCRESKPEFDSETSAKVQELLVKIMPAGVVPSNDDLVVFGGELPVV